MIDTAAEKLRLVLILFLWICFMMTSNGSIFRHTVTFRSQ